MIAPTLRILVTGNFGASEGCPRRVVSDAQSAASAALLSFKPNIQAGGLTLAPDSIASFGLGAIVSALGGPETATEDAIHAVLQDAKFAAADALWRGLARLADACAALEQTVELVIVDSNVSNFDARLIEDGLAEAEAHPSQAFDLVVIDHSLGMKQGHIDALENVANWCAALGTPVIAQADPAIFGVRHAIHLGALPDLEQRIQNPKSTAVSALRSQDIARWISLTVGRFLARAPHIDAQFPFFEKQVPERPETLPYASAAWLAAIGTIKSLATVGHAGRAAGFAPDVVHADLGACRVPGLLGKDTPETSTDVRFDDQSATLLLRGGFTPLLDRPQDGVAAFALLATLHRPNGPSLSRDGSLAHQAHTGAAARLLLQLEGEARERGANAETAEWLRSQFVSWYATGDSAVDVSLDGEEFRIELHPELQLDGKPVETELRLSVA